MFRRNAPPPPPPPPGGPGQDPAGGQLIAGAAGANGVVAADPPEMTDELFAANNEKAAKDFPHWTCPVAGEGSVPMFCFAQGDCREDYVSTGFVKTRRQHLVETGNLLKEMLTFECVENLLDKKLLTRQMCREWGAIMMYAGHRVPFNMVRYAVGEAGVDPSVVPTPRTEKVTILGLVLPTKESVGHLKRWYEAGGEGLDFEKDLVLPLMKAYAKYREEYPNVRGIELGTRSIRGEEAPRIGMSHARKAPHQDPEYPDLDIDELPADDAAMDGNDGQDPEPQARPIGYTRSGAPIWGFPV